MDCSLPGSSVDGISQARVLEWVAMLSSRGSSWPRDQTSVSCIAGGFLTAEPRGKTNLTCSWRQKVCKWSCIITILIIHNLRKSLLLYTELTHTLPLTPVTFCPRETDSDMKICLQKVYLGMLSGTASIKRGGKLGWAVGAFDLWCMGTGNPSGSHLALWSGDGTLRKPWAEPLGDFSSSHWRQLPLEQHVALGHPLKGLFCDQPLLVAVGSGPPAAPHSISLVPG